MSDIIVEIASTPPNFLIEHDEVPPNYIAEVAFGTKGDKGDSVFVYRQTWSFGINYVPNDVVNHNGSGYVCVQASFDNPPNVNPTIWQLIASIGDTGPQGPQGSVYNPLGEWDNSTNYLVNDLVTLDGSSYVCIANNHSGQPDVNPSLWMLLAQGGSIGAGVPAGGNTGEFLRKASGSDYDTEWATVSVTGNANVVAVFDGSGNLSSFDQFQRNMFNGFNFFKEHVFNDLNQNDNIQSYAVNLEASENSPNHSMVMNQNYVAIDTQGSGFDIGTNNRSVSMYSNFINHQGKSDIGGITMFDNNFTLGNGTDPIDVKGVSIAYGFGQVSANVNLSAGLQGYGFQFNVDAAASISNSTYNAAFYDFTNIHCSSPNYTTFAASPNIEEIQNNSNYNGLQITPNITTFTGNANFTGVGIYGNLGNFGSGSWAGVQINPTIAGAQSATGLNVFMDNVTVHPGVKASLVIQDLTIEADNPGSGQNGVTIEYTTGGTAGSEVVSNSGLAFSVQIEDGVSTATQVKAALDAYTFFFTNLNATISGVGSNPQIAQAPTSLAGGTDPGNKRAAYLDGDVEITGSLTFGGALSIGKLNAFATQAMVNSGGNPSSVHMLISAPTVADNTNVALADTIGLNTAMLLQIGANSNVTSAFIGAAALALPAVVSMGAGSTIDQVSGGTFAVSLDGGASGGSIGNLDLCRSLAIPNGVTSIGRLAGYKFDLPFGDPGTLTWGFYASPSCNNYMAGNLLIGGTAGSDDTVSNSSVGLEVKSTVKAFLPSRMTTTQRDALTAVQGMVIFNTTDVKLQCYDGSIWNDLF